MRSLVKATTVVAAVSVFLLSGLPGEAQETTPNPDVPELGLLQRFVGSWEHHVISKPAEWTPEKMAECSKAKPSGRRVAPRLCL